MGVMCFTTRHNDRQRYYILAPENSAKGGLAHTIIDTMLINSNVHEAVPTMATKVEAFDRGNLESW